MSRGQIHTDHPFTTPEEDRNSVRRLRGRLAAPVTIVTSGDADGRAGLTISSLVVAEGEPGRVFFLIGSATDLYFAIEETGRFIVHVAGRDHRVLSDVFAGIRPAPGGPFLGLDVADGEWGPALGGFGTRAFCRFEGATEMPYHMLVEGVVEHLDIHDFDDPLVYFRGAYRRLDNPAI